MVDKPASKASEVTCRDIKALITSADFRALSTWLDAYCPFDAVRVAGHEIRHSNYLANIITPDNPHGFGDACLQEFLCCLLANYKHGKKLTADIKARDLFRVVVLREHLNMDLVIEIPAVGDGKALVFIIEVKTVKGARDTKTKLASYEKAAKREWPLADPHFFFLTPDGIKASRDTWHPLSFACVVDGFENVLGKSRFARLVTCLMALLVKGRGAFYARWMLSRYVDMVQRRLLVAPSLEEYANKVWEKHKIALAVLLDWRYGRAKVNGKLGAYAGKIWRKHKPVLDLLIEHRLRDISRKFVARLSVGKLAECLNKNKKLAKHKLEIVQDTTTIAFASDYYFRFAVKKWDEIAGMEIGKGRRAVLIESGVSFSQYIIGAFDTKLVFGRAKVGDRYKFMDDIANSKAVADKSEYISSYWHAMGRKTLRVRADMDKLVNDGLPEKAMADIRKAFVDHWVDILPKIDKAFKGLPRTKK